MERVQGERLMLEHDPEPTDPMGLRITRDCVIRGCPCRATEVSAVAWGAAADAVELMDENGRVITFAPPKTRRR